MMFLLMLIAGFATHAGDDCSARVFDPKKIWQVEITLTRAEFRAIQPGPWIIPPPSERVATLAKEKSADTARRMSRPAITSRRWRPKTRRQVKPVLQKMLRPKTNSQKADLRRSRRPKARPPKMHPRKTGSEIGGSGKEEATGTRFQSQRLWGQSAVGDRRCHDQWN